MSTYTVRPNGTYTTGSGLTATGGTPNNVQNNIGDNTDVSYVTTTGTTPSWWAFGLTSPSPAVASDEFVCRVAGFIRWKDGTAGGSGYSALYVGVNPYRSTDTKPSYANTIATDGRTTFTTQDAGYATVAWTRTEVNTAYNLRTLFYTSRSSTLQAAATVAEIGANIYTLKQATATPTATTSTSTYATIPVSVTATIDWEATTYDWQNLRTVTIQVDVESGGTTQGTGTLVTRQFVDTIWTASGTGVNYNVTLNAALANGTYKIYTRAIRHRENEATTMDSWTGLSIPANSDQYGAWSSSATLTMNATPPSAPTVSTSVNQTTDTVTVSVTVGAAGSYTSATIDLQRSDDGGTTWTAVRDDAVGSGYITNKSASFSATATYYDYEAPQGTTARYRARVNGIAGGVTNTSAWSSSATASITSSTWNIKVPWKSALNIIDAAVVGTPSDNLVEDVGVFRALNRSNAVVVAGTLGGWDGDLTILTSNSTEWNALKAVLETQNILFLESPFGWSKYIRVIDGAKTTIQGTTTTPRRTITLSYVETDAP